MASLTVMTVSNRKDHERAKHILDFEAKKIEFLNPIKKLIDNCESIQAYNLYMLFDSYKHFNTDFVLVVQPDGRIFNPSAWSDDFFNYDYVGAPWAWHVMKPEYSHGIKYKDRLIGNGGFSLRSKKLCELLANEYKDIYPLGEPEDVFICQHIRDELESRGIKFAPYDIAEKFSVENQQYTGQFGVHCGFVFDNVMYNLKQMNDSTVDEISNLIGREFKKIHKTLSANCK